NRSASPPLAASPPRANGADDADTDAVGALTEPARLTLPPEGEADADSASDAHIHVPQPSEAPTMNSDLSSVIAELEGPKARRVLAPVKTPGLSTTGYAASAGVVTETLTLRPEADKDTFIPPKPDFEEGLRGRISGGDLDAADELASHLASDPSRLRESQDLLRWAVRRDPSRASSIRILHQTSGQLSGSALLGVAQELVSLFDRDVDAPESERLVRCSAFFESSKTLLYEGSITPWAGLLRMIWEGAMPLFRQGPRTYGVTGSDRVTPVSKSVVARMYADALRVLEVADVQMYVSATATREISSVPTNPPAVIAGPSLDGDRTILRFRVGRAVELARPQNILVASLGEAEGETLIEAIRAAFGPPNTSSKDVSREGIELAASLWNTVPARTQNHIRVLLAAQGDPPSYRTLRDAVFAGGAKAGLLVAGAVRAAVFGLLSDDPSLRDVRIDDEADFERAVKGSAALQEVIRFALSDPYLAARHRAMAVI
ncbi:MAG: hypothetical protein AAGF12_32830, partial [Myxococcota bacterium]